MIDYKTFDISYGSFGAEMIHEIINIYLDEYKFKVESMEKSIEIGDSESLGKVAHSLKGSTSVFYEDKVTELSRTLEHCGKNNNIENAKIAINTLKTEIERFAIDLAELKSKYPI